MPTVFSKQIEPIKNNIQKVDSLTFNAEKFSKSVDLTLSLYKKDSTNTVFEETKKAKKSGKNMFVQIAEYATAIITALALIFQKK